MSSRTARRLRKNLTDAEQKLWSRLRRRQLDGHRFRRQHPIGPYVLDFICLEKKLVVELDGSQHAVQADTDAMRTEWLESRGYRVARFWNNEVFGDIEGVLSALRNALDSDGQAS